MLITKTLKGRIKHKETEVQRENEEIPMFMVKNVPDKSYGEDLQSNWFGLEQEDDGLQQGYL
jgi:hypothetical protein